VNVCIFALVKLDIVLVLCSNVLEPLLFIYFKLMKHRILFVWISDLNLFNLLLLHLSHLRWSLWTAHTSRSYSSWWRLGSNLRFPMLGRLKWRAHSQFWRGWNAKYGGWLLDWRINEKALLINAHWWFSLDLNSTVCLSFVLEIMGTTIVSNRLLIRNLLPSNYSVHNPF
jgi:hypothetical protein